MRKLLTLFVVLALTVAVAACGDDDTTPSSSNSTTSTSSSDNAQPGNGKPAVTLGAKNFTEEFILGELYKQALEAKGYTIDLKSNIGSTEVIDKALTSGKIDAYPEYTGTIVTVVKGDAEAPKSAEETLDIAKEFNAGRGFSVSQPTPFQDRDEIGVLKAYADKNGLEEIGDLAKVGAKATLGAAPEFRTRIAGLKGLKSEYGLSKLKFKPLTIGLPYQALDQGKIQAADVFTTDGQLASGKYKLLKDPKNLFGFQNAVMVYKQELDQAQGPEFRATIDAVSAKLTNDAMQQMNAAVALDKKKPADVAKQFLAANGLS